MALGIYTITSPSGGVYVGSSINVKRRISQHKSALRIKTHYNSILSNACTKYGIESLRFDLVFCVFDAKDLIDCEQQFIDDLKPKYNMTDVAKASSQDKKVAKKISNSAKNSKRHAAARKENQKKASRAISKPVICLTTNQCFDSGYEAARFYGVESKKDQLCLCIKHGWRFAGHYWKFKGDPVTLEEIEIRAEVKEKNRKDNSRKAATKSRSKPVRRLSDGMIFESAVEASRKLNSYRTVVSDAIRFGVERFGSRWEYV